MPIESLVFDDEIMDIIRKNRAERVLAAGLTMNTEDQDSLYDNDEKSPMSSPNYDSPDSPVTSGGGSGALKSVPEQSEQSVVQVDQSGSEQAKQTEVVEASVAGSVALDNSNNNTANNNSSSSPETKVVQAVPEDKAI